MSIRRLTAEEVEHYAITAPAFIYIINNKSFTMELLICETWIQESTSKAATAKTAQAAALLEDRFAKIVNAVLTGKTKENDWEIMIGKWNDAHSAFLASCHH